MGKNSVYNEIVTAKIKRENIGIIEIFA